MNLNMNVKKIYLTLGHNCNLSCQYCSQHNIRNVDTNYDILNPDIFEYIKKISNNNLIKLIFYGGEPLLYWNDIVNICNTLNDNIIFSIITNGKALTQDRVDFINQHKIHVQLSWDGINVLKTRKYDAIQQQKQLILQINNLTIAGVMSALNYPYDFITLTNEFDNEYYALHNHHIGVRCLILRDNDPNSVLTEIDFDKIKNDMHKIIQHYDDMYTAKKIIDQSIKTYLTADKMDICFNYPKCVPMLNVINMDINGHIYACHNSDKKIGNIYDKPLDLIVNTCKIDNTLKTCEQFNCPNCKVLYFCCNCFMMNNDARKHYFCNLMKSIYMPIIDFMKERNNNENSI